MVKIDTMANYLQPFTNISMMRWAIQGLLINQIEDSALLTDDPDLQDTAYNAFMDTLSFDQQSKWECVDIIWGIALGLWFLELAAIQFNFWMRVELKTLQPDMQ
jgi:hypothetical protein